MQSFIRSQTKATRLLSYSRYVRAGGIHSFIAFAVLRLFFFENIYSRMQHITDRWLSRLIPQTKREMAIQRESIK